MRTIAVLGAGSWGTALAVHLGRIGHDVRLWARDPRLVADMSARRANAVYLPDITLPESVSVRDALEPTLAGIELVVSAVPSHGCRAVMRAAAPHLGAARDDRQRDQGTRGRHAAADVGSHRPGARQRRVRSSCCRVRASPSRWRSSCRPRCVAASHDRAARRSRPGRVPRTVASGCTASTDVVGVEIGGALKNVIAIAAGVVEGLGLGHNALAALITRGLAEISRLACAAGGQRETPAGLSGLGDLVLTCTGTLSRNRHVGIELARGRRLQDILAGMKMVAEGVNTTRRGARARRPLRRRAADRHPDGRRARRPLRRPHGARGADAPAAAREAEAR